MIDKTAIIDPNAKIAEGVSIGAYTIIGAEVEIGEGTVIGPHTVIHGPTKIGKHNTIFQFASVGADAQDKKYHGERAILEIGDHNTIREFCTINRGTENGGGITRIGDHNLLMAYVHIAHDCIVHNNTVFSNNASLSGHVVVKDHAILSGFSGVHQFVTVGEFSFVAKTTTVVKDVLPYVLVSGDPAEAYGLNSIGLRRKGFAVETIMALKRAYKIIYRQGLTVKEAVAKLQDLADSVPEVRLMIEGLASSQRGITR